MKKILIVTQYFYPENFIINGLAEYLANKNCKVCVYTGYPSYPHKKFYRDKTYEYKYKNKNIEIIRYPVFRRRSGRINLSLHYISYLVMGVLNSYRVLKNQSKWDKIFIFQTSPITVILIAAWLKLFSKASLITWVQDLWPDSVFSHFYSSNKKYPLDRFSRKFISWICMKIYSTSDILLAQSNMYKEELSNKLSNKDIKLIFNTIDDKNLNANHKTFSKKDKLKIISAGNFSTTIPYDIFIEAIKILKIKLKNEIIWNFYGNGTMLNYFRELVNKNNLSDVVKIHGRVEQDKLPQILKQNDVFLLGLIDEDLVSRTCPSRLIYAMANGLPIIASAKGEIAKILLDSHSGFCSNPNNKEELVNNIFKLRNMNDAQLETLSINSLKYYNQNFEKNLVFDKIFNLL